MRDISRVLDRENSPAQSGENSPHSTAAAGAGFGVRRLVTAFSAWATRRPSRLACNWEASRAFDSDKSPQRAHRGLSMSRIFARCEKRHRTGALQDAPATSRPARTPPGLGLRQPSGAFVSPASAPTNASFPVFMPMLNRVSITVLWMMEHYSCCSTSPTCFLLKPAILEHKHPPPCQIVFVIV